MKVLRDLLTGLVARKPCWLLLAMLVMATISPGCRSNSGSQATPADDLNGQIRMLLDLVGRKDLILPKMSLALGKSTEAEAMAWVRELPVKALSLDNDESVNGGPRRFITAKYDGFSMQLDFGNEADGWNDRLYSFAFWIVDSVKRDQEDTPMLTELSKMFGKPRIQPLEYYSGSRDSNLVKKENPDVHVHIWELRQFRVQCHYSFDDETRQARQAVSYWDPEFAKSHDLVFY